MAEWQELSGEHDQYFNSVERDLASTAGYLELLEELREGINDDRRVDPIVHVKDAVRGAENAGYVGDINRIVAEMPSEVGEEVLVRMVRHEAIARVRSALEFGCDTVGFDKLIEIEIVREGALLDQKYNLSGGKYVRTKALEPGEVLRGLSRQVVTAPLLGGRAIMGSFVSSKVVTGLYDKETGEPNVNLRVLAKGRRYGKYEREIQAARYRR